MANDDVIRTEFETVFNTAHVALDSSHQKCCVSTWLLTLVLALCWVGGSP